MTAFCSVPASAAPLHPALLRDKERARLGGWGVPLPVSLFQAQVSCLALHAYNHRHHMMFKHLNCKGEEMQGLF